MRNRRLRAKFPNSIEMWLKLLQKSAKVRIGDDFVLVQLSGELRRIVTPKNTRSPFITYHPNPTSVKRQGAQQFHPGRCR